MLRKVSKSYCREWEATSYSADTAATWVTRSVAITTFCRAGCGKIGYLGYWPNCRGTAIRSGKMFFVMRWRFLSPRICRRAKDTVVTSRYLQRMRLRNYGTTDQTAQVRLRPQCSGILPSVPAPKI